VIETRIKSDSEAPPRTREKGAYQEAELGFRNYWYPVLSSKEVTENPRHMTICGDDIVFLRRNGKAHAIPEYCPHRGTSLALYPEKSYPFRGSNTITCPYHGWTFDVTNGMCVANVCEGPNSKLPPLQMIKPYPVQEANGIVWIWMGNMQPVALDEDWPHFLFEKGRTVKFLNRVKNGNWRWHAENGPDGHAPMVHMNSPRMWFRPSGPQNRSGEPVGFDEPGIKGVHTPSGNLPNGEWDPYPMFEGYGRWPRFPLWRRILFGWAGVPKDSLGQRRKQVAGALRHGGICLPGYFLLATGFWPVSGWLSLEAYVPIDEDHYLYAQISTVEKRSFWHDLARHAQYYFWAKPISQVMFNNGDSELVPQTTRFEKRNGWVDISHRSWNDDLLEAWRNYCDENARGVGTNWRTNGASRPAIPPGMADGGDVVS
jgi:nitrite reductase/ring-hydroxylating ferredoxin subunit